MNSFKKTLEECMSILLKEMKKLEPDEEPKKEFNCGEEGCQHCKNEEQSFQVGDEVTVSGRIKTQYLDGDYLVSFGGKEVVIDKDELQRIGKRL